jgi:hypothetical protein
MQDGRKVTENFFFYRYPKDLQLPKTAITCKLSKDRQYLELVSPAFAYGVYIDVPDGVRLGDNYFHLSPGTHKRVRVESALSAARMLKEIKVRSLSDVE